LSEAIIPTLANAADALAGRGLFAILGGEFSAEISRAGQHRSLDAGEVLFHQGDAGDTAFILLSGTLDVWVDIGDERVRMAVLRPPQMVGEIAVFANQPRIATVIASEEAELLAIERKALLDLVQDSDTAGQAIIADLGRRLATVNTPLAFLSTATQLLRTERFDGEALAEMARNVGSLGPFADTFGTMVQEIRAKQERRQDMEMARRIQESVLPKTLSLDPGRAAIAATVRPMKEVGGDLYDYFMIDETRLAIAVADVSGKGVPASLFMMMFHTALRAIARSGLAPDEVMSRVNAQLAEDNEQCMFVTAFFGVLDIVTGELTYANAGHNPIYHIGADRRCTVLPAAKGMAVGLTERAAYKAQSIRLAPGDRLFLYTDGVTEAFSLDRELFGEERLERLLEVGAALPLERWMGSVLDAVDRFAEGAEQSDDITCLALAFQPGG